MLKMDSYNKTLLTLLVFGLICMFGGLYPAFMADKEWSDFATYHHCTQVDKRFQPGKTKNAENGKNSPTTGVTITIEIADKTGWLCDDGVTYWR